MLSGTCRKMKEVGVVMLSSVLRFFGLVKMQLFCEQGSWMLVKAMMVVREAKRDDE